MTAARPAMMYGRASNKKKENKYYRNENFEVDMWYD